MLSRSMPTAGGVPAEVFLALEPPSTTNSRMLTGLTVIHHQELARIAPATLDRYEEGDLRSSLITRSEYSASADAQCKREPEH
jgi:hypothetical protein